MLTIRKAFLQPGRGSSISRTGNMFADRMSVMPFRRLVQSAFLTCMVAILVACGGGGGGGDNTPVAAAGAAGAGAGAGTGTGVSQGVVTALGSVFVNGIEFSTTGATIRIDDNPGVESDLKVGMVVKVRGISDDTTRKGTATQVEARDILEGRISSVDAVNRTITVMGQTVRIEDNVTRLNDDDLQKVFANGNFQVNDMVEVHGFADDQGGVRATRVLRKATGEFESKGFVTGLGATSFGLSLTPGGTAAVTVNFTAGSLPAGTVNGSFVEVKSALAPVASAVTANFIRLEDKLGAAGEKAEVEGIVSSGTLASFVISGQRVVTSASTVFEGGVAGDFAIGAKLEAEGPLDANGAIAATKISFRSNVRIEADASAVTAAGLTLLGKPVAINQFTRIDNGPVVNGHVEIRAVADRDGNLIATRIVVQGASTKAFLQGPVTAADSAAGTLTILGNAVVSDGNTEWRVSSNSIDLPVSKAAFFAQIRTNATVVKVKWDPFTGVTAPIKEAEIETSAATSPAATSSTTTSSAATTSTSTTTSTAATTSSSTTTSTTTTTTLAAQLNGVALFNTNCSGCHGVNGKRPRTALQITNAIAGVGAMQGISLTQAQIAAIAADRP